MVKQCSIKKQEERNVQKCMAKKAENTLEFILLKNKKSIYEYCELTVDLEKKRVQ